MGDTERRYDTRTAELTWITQERFTSEPSIEKKNQGTAIGGWGLLSTVIQATEERIQVGSTDANASKIQPTIKESRFSQDTSLLTKVAK